MRARTEAVALKFAAPVVAGDSLRAWRVRRDTGRSQGRHRRQPRCLTYEGGRVFLCGREETSADGKKHKRPNAEAPETIRRLKEGAVSAYDEFLVLRIEATDEKPYPLSWVDENETRFYYQAPLVRIAHACQERGWDGCANR